jgi:hypothetical protein
MVDYTLCINEQCPYRNTCWRAIEKHKHDDGGERQSISHFVWGRKGEDCYIPLDGKRL